jgi:alcohol dehydrogenase
LRLIAEGRLDPTPFATHRFDLDEMTEAYDTFADAGRTNALKVVLSATPVHLPADKEVVAVTA